MQLKSGIIASMGLLALFAGCSVASSRANATTQCETNADCAELGFQNFTCSPQKVCIAPGNQPVANDDAGADAGTEGVDECTSNEKCVQNNGARPAICRKETGVPSKCVPLETDDCKPTGAWADPNAVYFGSFNDDLPGVDTALAALFTGMKNTSDLVLQEVNVEHNGLPGGLNGARRPLVALHCKAKDAAYKHITEVVKAPAAIVPWESVALPVSSYAQKNNTLVLCTLCAARLRVLAAGGSNPALLWNLVPTFSTTNGMSTRMVSELEAIVRAARPATNQVKVAHLAGSEQGARMHSDLLSATMKFNDGKNIVANGSNYVRVNFADWSQTQPDYAAAAQQIATTNADIVIMSGTAEMLTILPLIEAAWGAGPRPQYLMTTAMVTGAVAAFTQDKPTLRSRMWAVAGVGPAPSPSVNPDFNAMRGRYAALFPNVPQFPVGHQYEATYALAAAVVAAGSGPLDGTALSQAIPKLSSQLSPGPIVLDNARWPSVLETLASGPVNVTGFYSSLDWDIATGDVPSNVFSYCFSQTAAGVARLSQGGLMYDFTSRTFNGTLACPATVP